MSTRPDRRLVRAALCVSASLPALAAAQQPGELAPVVVSASGFEQAIKEAPASISVITREDLQQKRVGSVAEALSEVEGVDVGASAGKTGGLNISIRGMPSEYTLILIDGRRQNAAGSVTPNGFGETSTSFMPPLSAIERIEVIRGPMSTLYGSDAMGGVVNIITRKVSKEWGGSLTLGTTLQQESQFGNSQQADVYLSGPLVEDKLGLALRGSVFNREASDIVYVDDLGNVATPSRGENPVDGDLYSVGARLTATPNRDNELWLDADISRQRYNNDASQLGTLDDPAGQISGYSDELRFEREQLSLGHSGRLGIGRLETSVMHNTTETIGRTIPGSSAGGDIGQPVPAIPSLTVGDPRELETTNLIIDSKLIMPLDHHVATLGAQWWDAELTDGLATETYQQTTWSLFAEDEWLLRDDLALTLGARYDRHDAFGGQTSPRAYLVWSATDNWTFKGGVSRGYKAPALNDLHEGINGITGQGTRLTIGSPDLQPETSTSTELGLLFDNLRGFSFGATLFNNDFDDKIAAGNDVTLTGHPTIPDGTYSQKVNIDEAVTRGLELTTRVPLAQTWWVTANYTYTDSEQKSGANAGDELTDTPEHQLNARLNWQASERISAWLSGEYRSERFRGAGVAQDALGDYKAYTLFHVGGNYRLSENLQLSAAVYNLANKDFIDYRSYQDGSRTRYSNAYANNVEGRRLWLSLAYSF